MSLEIVLVEPFLTGSHESWARDYARFSRHRVEILGLPGRHWKWRMHGGAVTLARRFAQRARRPDLLLATDMLDLTTFLALAGKAASGVKTALYFHENQLTYPWSPDDPDPAGKRDGHYAYINFTSALAADAVLFNSRHHRDAFCGELPGFLRRFPDHNELPAAALIEGKSAVLPLGLDLRRFDAFRPEVEAVGGPPLILWNHRWEYDKNPEEFFAALRALAEEGLEFEVAVLGESFARRPKVFAQAREQLGDRVIHFGYAEDFASYARWLWRTDILPVTSIHDFFGISVVEALYCGCHPLLPRRLAYPEHLPGGNDSDLLYEDPAHLVNRLRQLLREPGAIRRDLARGHVARYDWGTMAPLYDALFEEIAEGGFGAG